MTNMQDKLFDRYEIKEEDREYYIPEDLSHFDKNFAIIMPRIINLAEKIPEFRLMMDNPTLDDHVVQEI